MLLAFLGQTLLIASTKHLKCFLDHHFHVSLPRTTLRRWSFEPFSPPFHRRVDPHQLQLHLLCKCAIITKCTPPCVCVLAFSQSFSKGLATQLAMPLDPSDDAKLDHSSGTITHMQTSLPLLIVWPSILNPVINFSLHL